MRAALLPRLPRAPFGALALGCLLLVVQPAEAAHKAHTDKKAGTHKSGKPLPSQQATQNKLAAVQSSIASAKQSLQLSEAEREQKEADMRSAEMRIGALEKLLRTTNDDLAQLQDSLSQLAKDRAQREADQQREMAQLQKDVQLGYQRGKDDYFKLLLNQQDPARVARLLKYYSIIQQAQADRIQTLKQNLKALDDITTQQTSELQKLAALKDTLQKQQGDMAAAQQSRKDALHVLDAQIESEDSRLKRLQGDASALQDVMQQLHEQARQAAQNPPAPAETPKPAPTKPAPPAVVVQPPVPKPTEPPPAPKPVTPPAPTVATAAPAAPAEQPASENGDEEWNNTPDYASSANAHCRLPVSGPLRASFGSPRAGGLRWNGVVIGASGGTPVRAVKAGRVVYAAYLRGYGFLVIVDHGHGLMSLYGQNESLLKSAGDSVAAGDSLALVGSSGGNSSPALYFEVRVKGRPTNPGAWCQY